MSRIYGWDQSHYDGTISLATMRKAVAEGIAFVTHKLGEGLTSVDTTGATALTAARDAGVRVIGAYWFAHGDDDPVAEADRCVAVADTQVPWWREFSGWFWQPDCETEAGHGKPSPQWIKKFADRLKTVTGRAVIVYASHGMYGNSLTGLGHPLWNANYGSNRKGAFASVYPGDNSAGWAAYSGQTPAILQYSSNATIAGLTTCDANAYLGTIDELLDLIGANDVALSTDDLAAITTAVIKAMQQDAVIGPDKVLPVPTGPRATTNTNGWSIESTLGWIATELYRIASRQLDPAQIAAAVIAALPAGDGVPLTEADVEQAVHTALDGLTLTATTQ